MLPKEAISNPTKFKLLLEFQAAFPNETPKTVEEYLLGGKREIILNVASSFLGFNSQKSKFENPKAVLEMFFREENNKIANEIYNRIKDLEKNGKEVLILNTYCNLKLFEIYFRIETDKDATQTEEEFEINLFKALLVLNSEFTRKQSIASESTKDLDRKLRFSMLLFCSSYPISDKVNYNLNEIWITQCVKSILLFQYLQSDVKTTILLSEFLDYFDCATWREYLKRILPLTTSFIKKKFEGHTDITVENNDQYENNCAFIEKLIVDEEDEFEAPDFLVLRTKPFYKVKDGVYRIIFDLFVVEKIFKGVYFLLRDINNKLPKSQKVSDLKSIIGFEFSEKVLTYSILKLIYPDNCVSFSGEALDKIGLVGAPDYYVRRGKDILLFESKDFLIPVDVKDSFDFSAYETAFEKKLYYVNDNGIEKPKAILQLINNIRIILRNEFIADKDYHYKEVRIYPVIITHDTQYDVNGFNVLINQWFQEEIELLKEEKIFTYRIQPLVVVNIDCLIYHQMALAHKISLHELLRLYVNHIKINPSQKFENQQEINEYLLNKTTPFCLFLNNYIMDRKWNEMPSTINELGAILFQEQ
jgi:hypothetical protein